MPPPSWRRAWMTLCKAVVHDIHRSNGLFIRVKVDVPPVNNR